MGVLDDNSRGSELSEAKLRITRCLEIFKVLQSKYFSYIYYYDISSNYEKGITHSVSNLAEFL